MAGEEPRPWSRRDFVPAPEHAGPADWRTALRARAPRCGIGVAIAGALVSAALFGDASGQPWTAVFAAGFALSLAAIPALVLVLRRQGRSRG